MTSDNDLEALSRTKWERMSAKDVAWLDGLFHDDAVFVHMGATFTKGEELDVIRTGRIHYREAVIEEISSRTIGPTGIVLTTLEMESVVDGNEVTNPFAVTETYVHAGDAWRLAAMSFTRLINR